MDSAQTEKENKYVIVPRPTSASSSDRGGTEHRLRHQTMGHRATWSICDVSSTVPADLLLAVPSAVLLAVLLDVISAVLSDVMVAVLLAALLLSPVGIRLLG